MKQKEIRINELTLAEIRSESDPTGRKAADPGAKLDAGKVLAGVLGDFSLALTAVAEVGTHGANKYSRGGWQHVPNADVRYTDALWRHILAENTEPVDSDSNLLHASHSAWNALARLELMLRQTSAPVNKFTLCDIIDDVSLTVGDLIESTDGEKGILIEQPNDNDDYVTVLKQDNTVKRIKPGR